MTMRKVAMPVDEMIEKGMTPQAREVYREKMRKWREQQSEETEK